MKKLLKLIILIILSLSVYFIYQKTKDTKKEVLIIGDSFSEGINSFGIKEYSYIDYYKDYLDSPIIINKKYRKKDLTIKELLNKIKNEPEIKKDIREADFLILNLGYNDLLYQLRLEENLNQNTFQEILRKITNNYQELLIEIKKYYKESIIIVGYPSSSLEDYYLNTGIKTLNTFSNNQKEVFIDTYQLLKNRKKYYSNPNSYYPNRLAYQKIAKEIITKTLEK